MRLVHLEDVELIVRKTVRSTIDYRSLLTGISGAIDNFKLIVATTQSDYTTPRHRHNFDQIRLQVGGSFDYDGLGTMSEGMVGYFPEGTPYGPSASSDNSTILLLQHAGASGWGYLSDSEYNASIAELKQQGEFRDGIYTVVAPDGRKRNQDGYEAVWENAYRREIVYAKPRYDRPIFVRPENFSWVGDREGSSYKLLGDFSERSMRLGFVGIAAGAERLLDDHSLYFVVSGAGRIGDQIWRAHTTVHVGKGERVMLRAEADAEIFHIGLPNLAGLQRETPLFAKHAKMDS